MNEIQFDKSGTAIFQDGTFHFRHDIPETGLFSLTIGSMTFETLPSVPGEYPETMALKGKRRPHCSADGTEVRLEADAEIPFGAAPQLNREYMFRAGKMYVRTDLILRHSFEMRSIVAGGLKIDGVVHLKITEQPKKPGEPSSSKTVDVQELEDGTVLYEKDKCPLQVVFTGKDKKHAAFELGDAVWRWNLSDRLPGKSSFILRKEKDSLFFHWNLFEFVSETPEAVPPHGRNLRFVWGLRYATEGKAGKNIKEVIDAEAFSWQDAALVSGPDGKHIAKLPCFASLKTLDVLKKGIRTRLSNAQDGDIYVLRVPPDSFCFSAVHENRGKKEILPHWDRTAKEEFAAWANRQLGQSGAKLVLEYADKKKKDKKETTK